MKKLLAVALMLVMLIGCFAGCGANDNYTTEEGKLIMATNAAFPPYEYKEGDEILGIDAEIAKLIADKLGLELEIVDVEFDSIITGVQSGKYDMGMAGMTVTKERQKKVSFSDAYAKAVQVIIVKEDSDIKSIDDLEGKKIGTQQGTTGYIYASDTPENGGYGEENVIGYENGTVAVEALKSDKIDCVIIDNEPAKAYVSSNEGLKILDTEFANEDYAICFSKKNTELQEKVNNALNELKDSGEFQKIVDKYIKAD